MKDYLIVAFKPDNEVGGALYGSFPDFYFAGNFDHIVQHDKDNDVLVTLSSDVQSRVHTDYLKMKHLFPLRHNHSLGLTQDNDLLLMRTSSESSRKLEKLEIGKVSHLIVNGDISAFKKDGKWHIFPVGEHTSHLNKSVVKVDTQELLFVSTADTFKAGVPVVIGEEGAYLFGKVAHIAPIKKHLELLSPISTSHQGIGQYKVANVTSTDIHKLMNLKPKQMEVCVSGRNQLTLYFLTEDGKLYGTGSNSAGRLGVSPDKLKEKSLLKEYQLIAEDVQSMQVLSGGGLIYARHDGTYYIGGNTGHAEGLLTKSHTTRPVKLSDKVFERCGMRNSDYSVSLGTLVSFFQFYTASGIPYIYSTSAPFAEKVFNQMVSALLSIRPFRVSAFPHRDQHRFLNKSLVEMLEVLPC